MKKRKRLSLFFKRDENVEGVSFEHPGILLENKEDAKILFKAIKELPETQKVAFVLSYIEDLPRQEVATIMETTLKAVESLLQRAKANLRKKLNSFFFTEGNSNK